MEAYGDTIVVEGAERKVDVLKVGRISLVYQTPDAEETGMWNPEKREWGPLDDSYRGPVQTGIRMARKQLSMDLVTLPVVGPEVAQQ
jgi:hypothetical protein